MNMRRIQTFSKRTIKYWTDAQGNEYDIEKMSDEYILNCIGFLQKKVNTFMQVPNRGPVVNEYIKNMKLDIQDLNKELTLRKVQDRFVDREDGIEGQ